VSLLITNMSTVIVSSVTVTAAQLGSLPMLAPTLPDNLGNLAAGAATTFTVNFDASSVPGDTIGPLVVQGTHVNGSGPVWDTQFGCPVFVLVADCGWPKSRASLNIWRHSSENLTLRTTFLTIRGQYL
jgi:hypothetical protein